MVAVNGGLRHARFATTRAAGAYDTDEVATLLEQVAAAVDGGDKTRTVELIRAVTFNGPPRRKPGYDPDAVDSYLRRLAAMFAPAGEPDPVEVVTPSSSETAAGRILAVRRFDPALREAALSAARTRWPRRLRVYGPKHRQRMRLCAMLMAACIAVSTIGAEAGFGDDALFGGFMLLGAAVILWG